MSISSVVKDIFTAVIRKIRAALTGIYHWLAHLVKALINLWHRLGPRWLRVLIVSVVVIGLGYQQLSRFLSPNLTQENIYSLHYLNDGWSQEERERFYYTPQGTELFGLEYQWFINLELPLSHNRLASEENMRGWGFVVDPGQRPSSGNPGNLPVGMGRHIDPASGKEILDIGCAACHTGELHYQGAALRIDGGQAVQSIPNAKQGEFITTLGASIIETLFNPNKWDRFATRLVGKDEAKREQLKQDLWQYAGKLKHFITTAGSPKFYPVEEGRGRTDAVGRIANIVFGYDLNAPENFRKADAPASYPFLWDIWRFDWVQYTGFTNQAMARNVGESLGVLAPLKLVDEDGNLLTGEEFGQSAVDIDGLHCAEGLLRKLEPPKWPEEILGTIDTSKATHGKQLFAENCQRCHGPHITDPYFWPVADQQDPNIKGQIGVNWKWDMDGEITRVEDKPFRKDERSKIWAVPWIDSESIGTDPKLVDNFIDNRYDASKLVPGSEPVSAGQGLQLLLNELVPLMYERWGIPTEDIADFDGLNVPFRIENIRAYKARPLHGVWATPPFLHNGSVPTIYDLLSPLRERPTNFYVGNREYNPSRLGYVTDKRSGSFHHDTAIDGNRNTGHLFTDLDMPGRIGRLLSEEEKFALLEYLKVMGNPDFDQALGGDPQNWAKYSQAPELALMQTSCEKSHTRHQITKPAQPHTFSVASTTQENN
ncbi:di-heme-cytochrome C peroxidase [Maricurvus nonylphenolicus]|uniref:di-heme-cytochrome C peroxidase n=1 Tax=Maricurvus nonylphenolicus TaxID=1008307 RepID=UPI0036F42396